MTKGEYPYPPDEFDAVDPSAGPRGVHRRPRGLWATLWPYGVALAASAVLAFVLIDLLWDDDAPPSTATVPGELVGTTDPPEGGTAADPTVPPAEPTPSAAPDEPPVTATPGLPEPSAPDLSTPVAVVNSTSVRGLAAEAAETLEDAGWTEVEPGNFTGSSLAASTVRYGDPAVEVSARAVADVLGITAVELAESDAIDGIEVVLELDFTR